MRKVYVGNLPSRIRERELADEFRAYGNVRSVWVARNPPGYAFIEFDSSRDAEDAVSALDGRHGWRVEMSKKSLGGRSHASHSSESRCYDCGATGHFARECCSRGSRYSRRRSPSPRSRTGNHSHSSTRSERDDRMHRDRSSAHRKRHHSGSPQSDKSEAQGLSPHKRRRERSRSPRDNKFDIGSSKREGRDHSRSPQNERLEEGRLNLENNRSEIDESTNRPDTEGPDRERFEQSSSPQSVRSDSERSPAVRDLSRSPRPNHVTSYANGYTCSPLRNGSASSRSPLEKNESDIENERNGEKMEEHSDDAQLDYAQSESG